MEHGAPDQPLVLAELRGLDQGPRIFIHSLRDIAAGEELTFDYGFDVDCYEDHPCLCGKPECVGHIVSRSQWPELKERLRAKGR